MCLCLFSVVNISNRYACVHDMLSVDFETVCLGGLRPGRQSKNSHRQMCSAIYINEITAAKRQIQ